MTLRDAPGLLLGLIGSGIEASRAPALHEGEAAEQGLRCIYKLIDITKLGVGADALPELLVAAERMCRNCHAALSDAQRDHPPRKPGEAPDLERVGRFLLGVADLLLSLAAHLRKFGANLIAQARSVASTGGVGR